MSTSLRSPNSHLMKMAATRPVLAALVFNMFAICYAKIINDKQDGMRLCGIYFGGLAETQGEAKIIACDCVNSAVGCTIIPKIIQFSGRYRLPTAVDQAVKQLQTLEEQMLLSEHIMQRNSKIKKKKK